MSFRREHSDGRFYYQSRCGWVTYFGPPILPKVLIHGLRMLKQAATWSIFVEASDGEGDFVLYDPDGAGPAYSESDGTAYIAAFSHNAILQWGTMIGEIPMHRLENTERLLLFQMKEKFILVAILYQAVFLQQPEHFRRHLVAAAPPCTTHFW